MLKVARLSYFEPGVTTLNNISFQAKRGEIVGIIGANGSGKSVLLRTIVDPHLRSQGEVTLNHFSLKQESEKAKLQIGYLAQPFTPELHLTGFEYLDFIGSLYHIPSKARVERILTLSAKLNCREQLYGLMERFGAALHQRIGLIASLIGDPAVVVWDEPLNHLDPQTKTAVLKLVEEYSAKGTIFVIATNDLGWIESLADQFLVLSNGELIGHGTLQELQHLTRSTKKDLTQIYQEIDG